MVNDLHEMMRDLGDEPAASFLDVDDVIEAGQRRVRRRRTIVGAGAGVAAACVIASTLVLADIRSADEPIGPIGPSPTNTSPSTTTPRFHPGVVTLDQATPAQLGRDYEAVSARFPDGVHSPLVSGPDGAMLVGQNYLGAHNQLVIARLGIVPAGTMQPEWYDSPTASGFTLAMKPAISSTWIVFATSRAPDNHADRVFVIDRSSGSTHQVLGSTFEAGGRSFTAAQIGDVEVSDDGTVYAELFDDAGTWLVSVPANGKEAPNLVGPVKGPDVAVSANLLVAALTDDPQGAAAEVTDLTTGGTTPLLLPPDQRSGCTPGGVSAAPHHILVMVRCAKRSLYDVYDPAGNELWTVDGSTGYLPDSFTDAGMLWGSQGRTPGPHYAFSFNGDSFLRFDAYGIVVSMQQAGDDIWVEGSAQPDQPLIFRLTGS